MSISVIIIIIFCNLNSTINLFFYLIILNISFNLLQTTKTVLSGLGSLASKGSAAEQIVTDGGVDVTIHAMEAHPSSASCARAGIEVFRILRDTHPDKLRALGSSAQSVASAIVGSLSSYNDNDGRSSTLSVGGNDGVDGGPSLEIGALEMLTDLCSASEAGVGLVIKAGGIKVALAALENQSGPNVAQ